MLFGYALLPMHQAVGPGRFQVEFVASDGRYSSAKRSVVFLSSSSVFHTTTYLYRYINLVVGLLISFRLPFFFPLFPSVAVALLKGMQVTVSSRHPFVVLFFKRKTKNFESSPLPERWWWWRHQLAVAFFLSFARSLAAAAAVGHHAEAVEVTVLLSDQQQQQQQQQPQVFFS